MTSSSSNDITAKALFLFEQSLEHPKAERAAFIKAQAKNNQALRAKALSYLSRDTDAEQAMHTGGALYETLDDTSIPKKIGAYKITGLIGRGGMGSVYLGKRASGDFDHDVAIKVIRPGAMSEKLVKRFETERQTLANLSHPNIARLYDGGTMDNGAPYIVMEYIDGMPITDWVRKNKSSKEERLVLFLRVCAAVEYAHQNLIVHRDLTPSNVLVDTTRHVKLIDFGIAKPFDKAALDTLNEHSLASLSFTPGFAAPERSKGAAASTLSDIYSLGKLLKSLLEERDIDREISAIIQIATAKSPQDRYGSVGALRTDIEAYLEGFPIKAVSSARTYRLRKFFGRHKFASLLGASSILGIVTALFITLGQYKRAEAARMEADARFSEVRELARFQLFNLYDELVTIPGNTKALTDIADKSKHYLDALSQDKRASLDLQLETAIGYKRLSDVMGNPMGANLGRRKEAGLLIDKAYKDLQALYDAHPDHPQIARALAKAAYSYAVYAFIAIDDNDATIKYARQSANLYDELINSKDGTDEDVLGKLNAELQVAKPLAWTGKMKQAVSALEALKTEITAYVNTHPDNHQALKLKANIYSELGDTMAWYFDEVGGDYSKALANMDVALDIYRQFVKENPDDYATRRSLASSHYKRAQIQMETGRDEDILKDMETAQKYVQDLLKIDPDDKSSERILKVVEGEMAMILASLGRADAAISLGQKAIDNAKAVADAHPENAGNFRDYTNRLYTFADVLKTLGRTQEACAMSRKALLNWEIIEKKWGLMQRDKDSAIKELKASLETCKS